MQGNAVQPIDSLETASWFPFSDEPVLSGRWHMDKLSSPAFLFPDEAPDGKWHLFAHSWIGIHHFVSASGIVWEPVRLLQVRSRHPSLFREKGVYYLVYERHGGRVPFLEKTARSSGVRHPESSRIEMRSSGDLHVWSEPRVLLDSIDVPQASDFPLQRRSAPRLSHPRLTMHGDSYRLYVGASEVLLEDSGRKATRFLCAASGQSPQGPFEPDPPVAMMQPMPNDPWRNLACGDLLILQGAKGYSAVQTGFYWDEQRRHTASALVLLNSADGLSWKRAQREPLLVPAQEGWACRYITGCDLRYKADEECWYCYFSAAGVSRHGIAHEAIGLLIGKEPSLRKTVETMALVVSKQPE